MTIRVDSGVGGKPKLKKPKKPKKQQVTSAQQYQQGRGGVAPANYKPSVSAPGKPQVLPKSILETPSELQKDDPLAQNVNNLARAAQNAGMQLTPRQAQELLTAADRGFSTNEWGQFLSPALAPDPFTANLMSVLRDYYEWTGKLPDATTAQKLVEETKNGNKVSPPSLFTHHWGNEPLNIFDILSDHANEKAEGRADNNPRRVGGPKGNRWSLKDIEKWGSVKKADYMRALANAPQKTLDKEWDVDDDGTARINNNDIDRINEARLWYGGTTLKHNINKRAEEQQQADLQQQLVNPDGTDNVEAARLVASMSGDKRPHLFAGIRKSTFGKPYNELTNSQKEDLSVMGAKLASVFPNFKPSDTYEWNAQFDKYASLYLFMSSIGEAVRPNPFGTDEPTDEKKAAKWKQAENRRLAATANISIATYGAVATNDDMRSWMQNMGFLGDKDKPGTFSDQFTTWLFDDCYMKTQAAPKEPLIISIYRFAEQNGGREGLPAKYRAIYDAAQNDWARTLVASQRSVDPSGAIANPMWKVFESELEGLDEANAAFSGPLANIQENTALAANADRIIADWQQAEGGTKRRDESATQRPEAVVNKEGDIIVGTTYLGGRPGLNIARQQTIDPDDDFAMFMQYSLIPSVNGAVEKMVNGIERQKNRLYLTLALMAQYSEHQTRMSNVDPLRSAVTGYHKRGEAGPMGTNFSAAQSVNPLSVPVGLGSLAPLGTQYGSLTKWKEAWSTAGEQAGQLELHPYMAQEFKSVGVDPTDEGGLLFWSDLSWSIGADFMIDAGITALAKGGAGGTAAIVRRLTSQALLDRKIIGDTRVAVQKGAQQLAELEHNYTTLMDKAGIAERNGDSVLAESFRSKAKSMQAEMDPTFLSTATPEEQLAHDIDLAIDPREVTVLDRQAGEAQRAAMEAENARTSEALEEAQKAANRLKKDIKKGKTRPEPLDEYSSALAAATKAAAEGDIAKFHSFKNMAELAYARRIQARTGTVIDTSVADAQLLNRPMWYDTFATGLAKIKTSGTKTQFILGVKDSHVPFEHQELYLMALERIGQSTDPDDIIQLMNYLRVNFHMNLDPGRLFLGRLAHYTKIMGKDPWASYTTVLPNDARIAAGARDATSHAYTLGHLTRMGMPMGKEVEANELMWMFIERFHAVDRSQGVIAANRERQKIWTEMNELIKANMQSRRVRPQVLKDVIRGAKRAGMDVSGIEGIVKTEWDAFNAFHRIKNWKRVGATVAKGGKKAKWYDNIQSSTPWLQEATRPKPVLFKGAKPLTRAASHGQQANDLTSMFNLHDLVAFQSGHAANQMRRATPIFGIQHAPTFMGMANAGRTLAVASMAFPISALFIDEFWRLGVELARGKISPAKYRMMKEITKGHALREAGTDAFEEMMMQAHEIVQITPDDPKYLPFLNRWLAAFKEQDFFDEYVKFLDTLTPEDLAKLSRENVKELFRQHLMDSIFGDSDVLDVMASTGRGSRRIPDANSSIYHEQDEWDEALDGFDGELVARRAERDDLSEQIDRIKEVELTVVDPKEFLVHPPLTDRVKRNVFPEYRGSKNPAVVAARTKFENLQTIENWKELKAAIVADLEDQLADANRRIDEAVELRSAATPAATTEPVAPKPKTAEEAMAEPVVRVEPDFEPIPEPMVRPELMMDEDYSDFTSEWLLENVEGLKYNRKTGEWNTKGYQREQGGYDSHAAFMNGGEEYQDDIDVIQEIMEENAEDMRFAWVGENGEDLTDKLPNGWEAQSTDRYHKGVELDTGETFDFYVEFDEGDNMWHLVEETSSGNITPRGKVDFDTLDDAIRYFEQRQLDEAVPAAPTTRPQPPSTEPTPAGKWSRKDTSDRYYSGEFVIQRDSDGLYHVGWADEEGELDFARPNDSHDRLKDAKNSIDNPENQRYLREQDVHSGVAEGRYGTPSEGRAAETPTSTEAKWVTDADNEGVHRIERGGVKIELTESESEPQQFGAIIFENGKMVDTLEYRESYLSDVQRKLEDVLDEMAPIHIDVSGGSERYGAGINSEPGAVGRSLGGTGLTDDGIDEIVDDAPITPPKDYEAMGEPLPDPDEIRAESAELEKELRRVRSQRKPTSLKPPVVVEERFPVRTTTVGQYTKVDRTTSKAFIGSWLRENGLIDDEFFAFQNWEWTKGFKSQDEVKRFFRNNNIDMKHYNQMHQDYRAQSLALRGVTDDQIEGGALLVELDNLRAQRKALRAQIGRVRENRRAHIRNPRPRDNQLTKKGDEYVDSVVDRLTMYHDNPDIWEKVVSGKPLTKGDLRRMKAAGLPLHGVMGSKGSGTTWLHGGGQLGYIPVLSKFAEAGPYRVLNWMGNKTREIAFLGNFSVEYRKLIRSGVSPQEALESASHRALDYVDEVMYSPGMTPTENNLGHLMYFLPAFRQATLYWAKQAMKNPVLFNHLRNTMKTDMPMEYGDNWLGEGIEKGVDAVMPGDQSKTHWASDYGMYIPLPFFATNSVTEAAVPGLSAPVLIPLRAINTFTGWKQKENGDYVYTGDTKLDWVSESGWTNPLTGFASKKVSPLSFVDDLFYGFLGDMGYGSLEADSMGWRVIMTALYSMRKDPIARRRASAAIMLAQISQGDKPNTTVYEKRLQGAPWWADAIWAAFGDQANPEALLGAATRQFGPRKISYSPNDIGEITTSDEGGATTNIWKNMNLFEDDDARTLLTAEYEYYDATGNYSKQQDILAKYPKLAEKMEFYKMDAFSREEYLMQEKNRWLIPYVTGKTSYNGDGAPLTAQEYNWQMETGALIRLENRELIEKVGRMYDNAEWSEVLKGLETVRDKRNKAAHKLMVELVKKYSPTKAKEKERLDDLEGFENKWWGYTAPGEYTDGDQVPSDWMVSYARRHFGPNFMKKQLQWNSAAITTAHFEATAARGEEGRDFGVEGERPKDAEFEGLEQYYSNDTVKKSRKEGNVGDMNRISDALNRFLEPDDKKLFAEKNSISINAIREKNKKDREKRQYEMKKILETPYYYLHSATVLESAMPGIFTGKNRIGTKLEMDEWLTRAEDLYAIKQDKQLGYDSWDDEYKAIGANYDKAMAKMMKERIAEPFRNGSAGMMLYTYLADPGEGKTFDKKYASFVMKAIKAKEPDFDDIADEYNPVGFKRPEAAEAANAWAGLFVAANALKELVEHERTNHPDDGHIGDVEDACKNRLKSYIGAWGRRSDAFRRQWSDEGSDKMIDTLLGSAY